MNTPSSTDETLCLLCPPWRRIERCSIYLLTFKNVDRESESFESLEEALAFKSYCEAKRDTENKRSLHLLPKTICEITGEIKDKPDSSIFRHFEYMNFSAKIVGDTVTTDVDSRDFIERYAPMVNCEGRFTLVDIADKSVLLPPVYGYINIKYTEYAEVMSKVTDTDDFREMICDGLYHTYSGKFIDIPRGRYLCNSMDYDSFQVIDNGLIYLCLIDGDKAECTGRGYNEIIKSHNNLYAVQDAETLLWGWLDKDGKEIIHCGYVASGVFEDGYAVVKDSSGRPLAIDLNDNIIIPPVYDEVEHWKYSFFFVRQGKKRAAFMKDRQLTKWKKYDEYYAWRLKESIADYFRSFHGKRSRMSIAAYLKLFDGMKTDLDLKLAGLWNHPVEVTGEYPASSGYIGWHCSDEECTYNMADGLPICFGESVVVVPFDEIRLTDNNIGKRRKQLYKRLMALDSDGIQYIMKNADRKDIFMFIYHQDEALRNKFLNECSQRVVNLFVGDVGDKMLDVLSDETLIPEIEKIMEGLEK